MAPRGPKIDKIWSDAVRRAVMRDDVDEAGKKTPRLNRIADNLCRAALNGDLVAIKEIGDRLDGRPKQQIEGSGNAGELVIRLEQHVRDL